jgi:putative endonuclease
MTNKINTVLYVGVTSNIWWRVHEHKNRLVPGFTSKYNANKLVYYEEFGYINDAIRKEKQLKGGSRRKKINLVNSINPRWSDLSLGWY